MGAGDDNYDDGAIDPFKTDAYSFGITLMVLLLGERGATRCDNVDGGVWMLPEAGFSLKQIQDTCDADAFMSEASDLFSELLVKTPAERKCLNDPLIRNHSFFCHALGCEDLQQHLMH